MRVFRFRTVALVIAVIIIAVILWLLIPLHPSAQKDKLSGRAYLGGAVRTNILWKKPFSSIITALPADTAAVGSVPFFLRPFIPPVIEFYLQGNKDGGGWAIVTDLGWRSKIFRMVHGVITGQMQYRGVGAIEGEYILRTPSGTRLLFYQDGRTLFIAEGENIIGRITGHDSTAGDNIDRADLRIPSSETMDKRVISIISFSNIDGDVRKGIEMLEGRAGFILLPSAGSLVKGSVDIRKTDRNTVAGVITLVVREDGDIEGVEGDVTYAIDVLDRFLSGQNMKTDRTINRENSKITVQLMIHPEGGRE